MSNNGVDSSFPSHLAEKIHTLFLDVEYYFTGFTDKRDCLEESKVKYELTWEQMAYLGDDWIDLSVMQMVGFPLAVSNVQPEVKSIAHFATNANEGQGAVRETIRDILIAQGKYNALLLSWSQ